MNVPAVGLRVPRTLRDHIWEDNYFVLKYIDPEPSSP